MYQKENYDDNQIRLLKIKSYVIRDSSILLHELEKMTQLIAKVLIIQP